MNSETSKGTPADFLSGHEHLTDELLLRYAEGDLSSREVQRVETHLNTCPFCFDLVASYFRQSMAPADESELHEIQQSLGLNPDKQFKKLFPAAGKRPIWSLAKNWLKDRLKASPGRLAWEVGGALATLCLAVYFLALPQYHAWQSQKYTSKSLALFTKTYAISSREAPRPSGGFEYSEFGKTRGPEQAGRASYVASLQKAIELNKKNARALQYLGTHFLVVENDMQKARRYYQKAQALDPNNPSILNDLGVLSWREGKFEQALANFQAALQQNPQDKEAQYNLAMLYQTLKQSDEAKKAWQRYLQLDPNSDWSTIARLHLKSLQNP